MKSLILTSIPSLSAQALEMPYFSGSTPTCPNLETNFLAVDMTRVVQYSSVNSMPPGVEAFDYLIGGTSKDMLLTNGIFCE